MKKILSILFVLMALVLVITSCGEKNTPANDTDAVIGTNDADTSAETDEPEPEVEYKDGEIVTVASKDGCSFTVVRPAAATPVVSAAASSLRKAIAEGTGASVEIKTDDLGKVASEILVGVTDRKESASASEGLGEMEYHITFTSSRIAITGGSDTAVQGAASKFIELFLKDGVISVPFGTDIKDSCAPKLMVGDNDLADYKIYAGEASPSLIESFKSTVFGVTGVVLPDADKAGSDDDKIIEFVADSSLDEGYYSLKVKGNKIVLSASHRIGLMCAVNAFKKELEGKNKPSTVYELNLSASGMPKAFDEADPKSDRYFLCETNKDALSYEIEDNMVFDIYLVGDGELLSCASFKWTITGDDGSTSSGTASGAGGVLTLETSLSCNGFVYIKVLALDHLGAELDSSVRFEGGAGVHPEKLTTTVKEPDDFDEFWAKSLAELDKVKPNIIEMEEVNEKSGYKTYKMKLECVGDPKWTGETYVSGYLTYPENASAKSIGLAASFSGYGTRLQTPSYNSTKAVFTIYTHSIEVGQSEDYYKNLESTKLKNYGWSEDENKKPEDVYFRYLLLRDLQAIRFMKQYFGPDGNNMWDGKTLTVSGGSQGGFQTIAIAALDHDVSEANASIPWLCDIGGYTDGKRLKSTFRPNYVPGLSYVDTASFASRVQCPVTITAGLGDTCCPPSGVFAMYNALKCPKTLKMLQNKTHGYTPPVGDVFTFTDK